ncbi:hypothetical protein [Methylobacterium nigriterrae]|uniref:hypothetical protein n=1 Tax=Methylobacterium nigriterrae TaxID=3127512 RepID=UPI003013A9B1
MAARTVIVLLSFACLASGVGLAVAALRDPARAPQFERWSGICLVAGLALLGAALHFVR